MWKALHTICILIFTGFIHISHIFQLCKFLVLYSAVAGHCTAHIHSCLNCHRQTVCRWLLIHKNTNIVNHTKWCALYHQPSESTSTKRIYVAILYTNEASKHLKLFQMKLRIVKSAFVPSLRTLNPINAHTVCMYDNDKYLTTCIQ